MIEQIYRVLVIILLSAILLVLYLRPSQKPASAPSRFVSIGRGLGILDTQTGQTYGVQGNPVNVRDLRSQGAK